MSARLTTAIKIGRAARAILNKSRAFPEAQFGKFGDMDDTEHVGVEPMLLALGMELALKAWFVFDYDDANFMRSHDLVKLFGRLKPDSQKKLDAEFKTSVAPYHPSGLHVGYSIHNILAQHRNTFIDWRYLHETKESMLFEQEAFAATLEMVLREFEKRYRIEQVKPFAQN